MNRILRFYHEAVSMDAGGDDFGTPGGTDAILPSMAHPGGIVFVRCSVRFYMSAWYIAIQSVTFTSHLTLIIKSIVRK